TGTFLPDSDEQKVVPISLQIKRGDPLFEPNSFGPISIIKVDVEGFEADVFRGLKESIHRDHPVIMTEVTDESRRQFGSEHAFRSCFYPNASFFEVAAGRRGFTLRRFVYESC